MPDSAAALAAFLAAPAAASYDPVTRQYLVFAWAIEQAARTGALDPELLVTLCRRTGTIYQPELATLLPAEGAQVAGICNLLAQACAELVPARPLVRKGLLVSLEGGDGSGKTTQTQLLAELLATRGHQVVATRALGGAGGASLALRQFILDPDQQWTPLAEALLTASVCRETFTAVIFPALAAGQHVICDRLVDTLLVYLRDEAMGIDRPVLNQIYDILVSDQVPGLEPDLTFILDLPFSAAMSRRTQRSGARQDRNEAKGEAFHRAVFADYLALAQNNRPRCVVIDALQLPLAITARMAEEVEARLGAEVET